MKIDLDRFVSEYKDYKGFKDINLLDEVCNFVFNILEHPDHIHDYYYEYLPQLKALINTGVPVAILIEYHPEKIMAIPKKKFRGGMMENFDTFNFTNNEVYIVSTSLVDLAYLPKENFKPMFIKKNGENFDVESSYDFYSFKTGVTENGNFMYSFPSLHFLNQFFEQYCHLSVSYSMNAKNLKDELQRAYDSNQLFETSKKNLSIPGCCSKKRWSNEAYEAFIKAITQPDKVDQDHFNKVIENQITSITSILIPYSICNAKCKKSFEFAKNRLNLLKERCPSLLKLIYDNFNVLEHTIDLFVLETYVKVYMERTELKEWYKRMLNLYRAINNNKEKISNLIEITQFYNLRREEFGDFSLIESMKKEDRDLFLDQEIHNILGFRYSKDTDEFFNRLIDEIHQNLFVSLNIFKPCKIPN